MAPIRRDFNDRKYTNVRYLRDGDLVRYSGGSNIEHLNSEPIQNPNILNICIGMVWLQLTLATAMH